MVTVKDFVSFVVLLCLFYCVVFYFAPKIPSVLSPEQLNSAKRLQCDTVDVVYTWVNGSDPVHLKRLKKYKDADDEEVEQLQHSTRYREYDTLRYSMRSVYSLFKMARLIHLVIADDEALPLWLEPSHEMIRIVRHSDIMPKSVLPTFNSNAIETNLHLIDNLASCFVYLNDDVLFGRRQTDLREYWDEERGVQKVHFGPWKAPWKERMDSHSWHRSIAYSNERLDKAFGKKEERAYPLHGCHFFHKKIFEAQREKFSETYEETLGKKFRSSHDNVVSFIYPHFAQKEFGAITTDSQLLFGELKADPKENIEFLRYMVRRRPTCICINDGLKKEENGEKAILEMRQALEVLLPNAAPWEKKDFLPKIPEFNARYFTGSGVLEMTMKMLVAAPVVVCCILIVACFAGGCLRKTLRMMSKRPQGVRYLQ